MILYPFPLELARRARGLTQSELASRANLSRWTITQAEHGYIPSEDSQQRIAGALGVDAATLWPVERREAA